MPDVEVNEPMCPLLTAAAGQSRPCAREGCAWWKSSFDERYSRCVTMEVAATLGKLLTIQKRMSRTD